MLSTHDEQHHELRKKLMTLIGKYLILVGLLKKGLMRLKVKYQVLQV